VDERTSAAIVKIVDEAETFGEIVDKVATVLDLNDYQLSFAIGLLPGKKGISSRQIGRMRTGQQRNYDRALVARLIEVLGLNPDPDTELKVWRAADRWPPGMDPDELISELTAARRTAAVRAAKPAEGASFAATASSTDQENATTATLLLSPGTRAA
jgi:hypothetical protein